MHSIIYLPALFSWWSRTAGPWRCDTPCDVHAFVPDLLLVHSLRNIMALLSGTSWQSGSEAVAKLISLYETKYTYYTTLSTYFQQYFQINGIENWQNYIYSFLLVIMVYLASLFINGSLLRTVNLPPSGFSSPYLATRVCRIWSRADTSVGYFNWKLKHSWKKLSSADINSWPGRISFLSAHSSKSKFLKWCFWLIKHINNLGPSPSPSPSQIKTK